MRLGIAAGGTGGHVYPALAIAEAWCRQDGTPVMLVAGQHTDEHLALARDRGFEAVACPAVRLRRSAKALLFPFLLVKSVLTGRAIVRQANLDCVLGMGSFASFAACRGAATLGVPLLLHEGNARAGRANRWLSRHAETLAVSFPLEPGYGVACDTVQTGLPLRPAILDAVANPPDPRDTADELGLEAETPTLLVFGGSQGARAINNLLRDTAPRLAPYAGRLQIVHLTGSDDNRGLTEAYAAAGITAAVMRADPHIERGYALAGCVVCRSGASTVSELALFGKRAILLPLPTAADDHQTANARAAQTAGGATLLPQTEATPQRLAEALEQWLANPPTWETAGKALAPLAAPDAADRVVRVILDSIA